MKTVPVKNRIRALTLIEVLAIVAVLMFLAALLLPTLHSPGTAAPRIHCINNLKQVGIAYRLWAMDHNDSFPMQVSTNEGGTMEFVEGPNAWLHFQVMSNELNTPKILFCPSDSDPSRGRATTFDPGFTGLFTGNTNLSYFVGVDALQTNAYMFLSGDHNITNGISTRRGILELTTNTPASWTDKMHAKQGNIGIADGSVQGLSSSALRFALAVSGVATNRLSMP